MPPHYKRNVFLWFPSKISSFGKTYPFNSVESLTVLNFAIQNAIHVILLGFSVICMQTSGTVSRVSSIWSSADTSVGIGWQRVIRLSARSGWGSLRLIIWRVSWPQRWVTIRSPQSPLTRLGISVLSLHCAI